MPKKNPTLFEWDLYLYGISINSLLGIILARHIVPLPLFHVAFLVSFSAMISQRLSLLVLILDGGHALSHLQHYHFCQSKIEPKFVAFLQDQDHLLIRCQTSFEQIFGFSPTYIFSFRHYSLHFHSLDISAHFQ